MLSASVKQHIIKLSQKKHRKEFQEFLVEGIKGVDEALRFATVLMVIVEGSRRDEPAYVELIAFAEEKQIAIEYCGRKDVDAIKTTETFPGVMAVVELPETELIDLESQSVILALDGIKDPGNLGTIIRTADWFGVSAILLSEDSVDPYNEKCVRSTMGSIFRMSIHKTFDLKKTLLDLKEKDWRTYTFSMSGTPLQQLKKEEKSIYIFGSESQGVHLGIESIADGHYTIPGNAATESLNVSIASAIVLWELKR
jgi:TrmH family RNA methyltransferase